MTEQGHPQSRARASGRAGVLDEHWVRQHLIARGLIEPDVLIAVEPLTGGVSSDIVAVSGPTFDLVVKRALPRLRVEEEWLADAGRLITEGRALRLAHTFIPDAVPAVVDLDEDALTLVLARAPRSWTNWRDDLLAGAIDPAIGRRLGGMLATWHRKTASSLAAVSAFGNVDSFIQLRINPFFHTIAHRHPPVAQRIERTAERLLSTKACLVHGDFSPKNILTGEGSQWVLDWEVAHVGDPAFDLGYLIAHLVLKAVHRRAWAMKFQTAAHAFVDGYRQAEVPLKSSRSDLAETVACLLLARVDGKSPAEYLSAADQRHIRALALDALSSSPVDVLGTWVRG